MTDIKKTRTAAIIAEYNPFHNGHKYHIERTRELTGADNIVVIMSGNFVQRGECASFDKFSRAKAALNCGADLVVELPLSFACAGAEKFAQGGVGLADALGCVDYLSFGMECNDVNSLIKASSAVDDEALKPLLSKYLAGGRSFAAARTLAISELCGGETAELLCMPNNSLAIEYIRALKKINSNIVPIGIQREGVDHDTLELNGGFASATAIREMLKSNQIDRAFEFMPKEALSFYKNEIEIGKAPADLVNCERAILSRLRGMTREQLKQLPDISEGLENRLYDCIRSALSLESLYDSVKSKRYTHARIRRIILSAFLGIKTAHSQNLPYIRLLGMNRRGRALLSETKPALPVISSYKNVQNLPKEAQTIYTLECCADDLWALMTPCVQPCGLDMTSKLIVLQ